VNVGSEEVRLTSLSHGAGCACKLGPDELAPLLNLLPRPQDPNLLVGAETSDDAAVYRLSDQLALVHTVDFFTPIVDDPYDFGRIAAANAVSDVYAMGGEPLLALNLVAFSLRDLDVAILERILAGGAAIAREAGVAVAGGHSIDDPEPKYGMAVVGTVDPSRVLTNAGGRPGDLLYLTKPLGTGLMTTAAKKGLAPPELVRRATEVMIVLNAEASRTARAAGARAMTDVTGFGLLGHLHELCEASGVAAEVEAAKIPAIDGALGLAGDERCLAGGSRRNAQYADGFTDWGSGVAAERRVLMSDAMTSGGLLFAAPPPSSRDLSGLQIGQLSQGKPGEIRVR
jgi:selenide,water dikinase